MASFDYAIHQSQHFQRNWPRHEYGVPALLASANERRGKACRTGGASDAAPIASTSATAAPPIKLIRPTRVVSSLFLLSGLVCGLGGGTRASPLRPCWTPAGREAA